MLDDWDRGLTLWEMLAIGAGSDTVDPMKEYYIAYTVTAALTIAACTQQLEAYYNSGD